MNRPEIRTIALIGAGNVAWHLGHMLAGKGIQLKQIMSRRLSSAQALASAVGAEYTNNTKEVMHDVDAYILAVSDDALEGVIQQIEFGDRIAIHTAGSIDMQVFHPYADNYGVLYPLQTFTKGRDMDLGQVPFLIEASNSDALSLIRRLAGQLSDHVVEADSLKRMKIHVAAVFACNFSNHMCALAEMILNNEHLSFEMLKPLIKETLHKVSEISPLEAQTGPAQRDDVKVMLKHLKLLNDDRELQQLYSLISQSIKKQISRNND